jgi:hypothetical protein
MPSYLTRSVARKNAIENKSGPVSVKEDEDQVLMQQDSMYNFISVCQMVSIVVLLLFLILLASK